MNKNILLKDIEKTGIETAYLEDVARGDYQGIKEPRFFLLAIKYAYENKIYTYDSKEKRDADFQMLCEFLEK